MPQTQQFPQTDREKIVVKAGRYGKKLHVDVRVWFVPRTVPAEEITPEDWFRTKKGVHIRLEDAQPIAQAIVDIADDIMREIEVQEQEEAEAEAEAEAEE